MSRLHRPCYKAYISLSVFDVTVYAFSLHSCVFIFVSFIFNRTWSVRLSSIIIVWRERNNFIYFSVWFLLWAGFDHVTNKVHLSTKCLFLDAVGPMTKKKAIIAYNHILKLMSICIKYFYRRYKAIIYALRYMKHTWSSYINMLFS